MREIPAVICYFSYVMEQILGESDRVDKERLGQPLLVPTPEHGL